MPRFLALVLLVCGLARSASAQNPVYVDANGMTVGHIVTTGGSSGEGLVATTIAGVPIFAELDVRTGLLSGIADMVLYPDDPACAGPGYIPEIVGYPILLEGIDGPDTVWAVPGDATFFGTFTRFERGLGGECVNMGTVAINQTMTELIGIGDQPAFTPPIGLEVRPAGDVNGDGLADAVDIAVSRRLLAGLPVNLP